MKKTLWVMIGLITISGLSGCVSVQPRCIDNVCEIFKEYPSWYSAAKASEKKWGAPVSVQMAIMHQESSFLAKAKPPRQRLLGFIPWSRPSSAYGYPQALNDTWRKYQQATGQHSAKRHNFADASDFIGWYLYTARRQLGIAPNDAFELYLVYHEGCGGYKKRSHLAKHWLMTVARKVSSRARLYQSQLAQCRASLVKRHWWSH